jgi:hypothetical protein
LKALRIACWRTPWLASAVNACHSAPLPPSLTWPGRQLSAAIAIAALDCQRALSRSTAGAAPAPPPTRTGAAARARANLQCAQALQPEPAPTSNAHRRCSPSPRQPPMRTGAAARARANLQGAQPSQPEPAPNLQRAQTLAGAAPAKSARGKSINAGASFVSPRPA